MSEKPFREFFLFGGGLDDWEGGGADFIGTYSTEDAAKKAGGAHLRKHGGSVHIYRFDGEKLWPLLQREEAEEWEGYRGGQVRY